MARSTADVARSTSDVARSTTYVARSTTDVVQSVGQGSGSSAGKGSDLRLTWC